MGDECVRALDPPSDFSFPQLPAQDTCLACLSSGLSQVGWRVVQPTGDSGALAWKEGVSYGHKVVGGWSLHTSLEKHRVVGRPGGPSEGTAEGFPREAGQGEQLMSDQLDNSSGLKLQGWSCCVHGPRGDECGGDSGSGMPPPGVPGQ